MPRCFARQIAPGATSRCADFGLDRSLGAWILRSNDRERPVAESDFRALDRVPFCVTEPTRIPAQRYYDPEFFALENERLWPHVWQMACRLEEIPEVGDWVEYTVLQRSVVIVRTGEGIKAYHNACRHRGVKLANGSGNCAHRGLTCPFHGWRWNMDGENTFVFGRDIFREADLDPEDLRLVSCRVETWGGCAFINFDDDAAPLVETLGEVTARLDSRLKGELKVDWWHSAVLPVNWKLAMEAFMEGYHVMATHPQLHAVSPAENRMYGVDGPDMPPMSPSASGQAYVEMMVKHIANLHEGMGGMITPWEVSLAEEVYADLGELPQEVPAAAALFYTTLRSRIQAYAKETGRPHFDLVETAAKVPFKAVEYIFPNYFLLPMFSGMSSYRVRPLTEETCLFEIWSLSHYPQDEERSAPVAPKPTTHDDPTYPEIPRQDYANLPQQQLGLHAQGFEFMRLSPKIEGMISNYQRLIDGFLARRDPEDLTKATALTCSGFDAPLIDIGF
ncbi:aromatic ring-hydroxylating oxygenase subunit alpha [Novosphingobium sp. JCM 18896]|uniref:aromatic ring-hydroxylating oxygenase subunit alpha n=1 Tax=Novosphingobium sp. JCM 18896 TaxID=2989731 RepID=UPI00222302E6|nr:aromatic ring-hydroxylating dioxygenase subunit alpha [Novosphingobium sp. JCM 18896]MCW1430652.1 aromatic ring-hydroxylating dioxygenase subunit alpha [Novosphingobium sp. JCM 18896]